jgi:tRNA(His) guanylyltransferase
LKGSVSKDKNEILFSQFGINYNKIEEVFRRGTVFIRRKCNLTADEESKEDVSKKRKCDEFEIVEMHADLVENDKFY